MAHTLPSGSSIADSTYAAILQTGSWRSLLDVNMYATADRAYLDRVAASVANPEPLTARKPVALDLYHAAAERAENGA